MRSFHRFGVAGLTLLGCLLPSAALTAASGDLLMSATLPVPEVASIRPDAPSNSASFLAAETGRAGQRAPVSPKEGEEVLARAIGLVRDGRYESGWEEFARNRRLFTGADAGAPAAAERLLIELGDALEARWNSESALDAWQVAALRGSRAARLRMADAFRRSGWPVWARKETLEGIEARLAEVRGVEAFLVSARSAPAPPEKDPIASETYRQVLAVYRKVGANAGGSAEPGGGRATDPFWMDGMLRLRFLIRYRQADEKAAARKLGEIFATMGDLMETRLGRHTRFHPDGVIRVWLSPEGAAGGEQWRDHLFFHDPARPRSNLEWVREAAHEYGHMALPGSSGFSEPEGWLDGEMGERLLLRWLLDAADASGDEVLDHLGLRRSGLEAYVARYFTPLVTRFAATGWRSEAIRPGNRAAMEHAIGLALWAAAAHGVPFLRDALDRMASHHPDALWRGYVAAARRSLIRRESASAGTTGSMTIRPTFGVQSLYLPETGWYRITRESKRTNSIRISRMGPGRGTPALTVARPGASWRAEEGWYRIDAGEPVVLRRVR